MEYRFRTNTVGADDIGDLDWDLTPNGVELRTGGNALCDDGEVRPRWHTTPTQEEGVQDDRSSTVSIFGHYSTADNGRRGPFRTWDGRNRILICGEQSFDEA